MYAIPTHLYPKEDELLRPSLVIAHLAILAYQKDIVNLVCTGINLRVNELKNSDDPTKRQQGVSLQKDLKSWKSLSRPLHYEAILNLIRIISPGSIKLPPASPPEVNVDDFVQDLITAGKQGRVRGVPFIHKGQFQYILPSAIEHLSSQVSAILLDPDADSDSDTRAALCFKTAMLTIGINAVPWTPPAAGPGRPFTIPSITAWVMFGGRTIRPIPIAALSFRPAEQHQAAMENALEQRKDADPNAPWAILPVKMRNLHKFLNRRILPSDFTHPDIRSESPETRYVRQTYDYAAKQFDLSNPLHHLALLLGVIYSKLCPNVFTEPPRDDNSSNALMKDEQSAREYLNSIPWSNRMAAGKKGNIRRDLYISMIAFYIVAIYDRNSPLVQHFEKKRQFGRAWTEKHSEFPSIYFSTPSTNSIQSMCRQQRNHCHNLYTPWNFARKRQNFIQCCKIQERLSSSRAS